MAKAPAFDPKRIAASVPIEPLVTRTVDHLREQGAMVLLFDSRLETDSTRALHTIVISPQQVSGKTSSRGLLSVEKAERDGVADRFLIQYAEGEGQEEAQTLAVVTVDFSRQPYTTAFQLLQEDQRDAVADAFCVVLRDKVLGAFAEAMWSESTAASPEAAAIAERPPGSGNVRPFRSIRASATRRVQSATLPAAGNRRRLLAKGATVAAVLGLLVWGASGFVGHKREPDMFAGIDPAVRAQLEASGLKGSPTSAIPNVTEQTLRAMGLDPGKAASNLGCLAK